MNHLPENRFSTGRSCSGGASRSGLGLVISIFAGILLLAPVVGCAGSEPEPPAKTGPILVVAMDGFEWRVALPLLAAGELPNIESLMRSGRFGKLQTFEPTLSPLIWTSIATGKTPEKHGILDVIKKDPVTKADSLYSSGDRKTKAIWNILSENGQRIHSIGWWKTFPVEEINGVMVPQLNLLYSFDKTGLSRFRGDDWSDLNPLAYPTNLHPRVMDVAAEANADVAMLAQNIFGKFPHPHSQLGIYLLTRAKMVIGMDAMHFQLAQSVLARREPYDMLLVYFRGADVLSHAHWRYAYPDLYLDRPSDEEIENYSGLISRYYRHLDLAVGALMESAGKGARIVLLSDHGMGADQRDASYTPVDPETQTMSTDILPESRSGAHADAPPGFFVASGPGIISSDLSLEQVRSLAYEDLETIGSVYDVAPTLLVMKGLAVARDMDGSLMEDLLDPVFLKQHARAAIDSYDTPEWLATRGEHQFTDEERDSRIEELRSLGYID